MVFYGAHIFHPQCVLHETCTLLLWQIIAIFLVFPFLLYAITPKSMFNQNLIKLHESNRDFKYIIKAIIDNKLNHNDITILNNVFEINKFDGLSELLKIKSFSLDNLKDGCDNIKFDDEKVYLGKVSSYINLSSLNEEQLKTLLLYNPIIISISNTIEKFVAHKNFLNYCSVKIETCVTMNTIEDEIKSIVETYITNPITHQNHTINLEELHKRLSTINEKNYTLIYKLL